MTTMLLDRKVLFKKNDILACIRNTSCSRGWLRLLMQIIFGTIIVSSFILILLMALNISNEQEPEEFCFINNCRVTCHDVPFFNDHEHHIINAVSKADAHCGNVAVELNRPTFKDFILPENWLSRMPSNVRELSIIGGNINTIAPHAFMTPFSNNLNILILEELILFSWHTEMLLGLSNLRKLYLKNCMIGEIKTSALKPVDDTLTFLDVKASNHFDPSNITGSSNNLILNEVDFSSNNFFDILGRESFSKLHKCKVLFLNSCHITFIGEGIFDNLYSIEVLYLNNNFLTTIPVGLFDAILPYRPRIALQDNFWHCECSNVDLRAVLKKGLLIIEPVCDYPDIMKGLTFSDFEGFCKTQTVNRRGFNENRSTTIFSNIVCDKRKSSIYNSNKIKIVSPLESHRCLLNRIKSQNLSVLSEKNYNLIPKITEWISPVFRIEQRSYTMVEMATFDKPGLGLLWYASCQTEVYCINVIPSILKLFNIISGVRYTFCPFNISTGLVYNAECVSYDLEEFHTNVSNFHGVIVFISIGFASLIFGALFVYILILKKPTLLKANKRVLFVKHKSIQALILPPKVPLRKNESDSIVKHFIEKENIFILPDMGTNSPNIIRSTSTTRSIVSDDGSYISALQPTEEQLKEWRSNQIVKEHVIGSSSEFNTSPFTSFSDRDSFPYYTLHSSKEVYGCGSAPE